MSELVAPEDVKFEERALANAHQAIVSRIQQAKDGVEKRNQRFADLARMLDSEPDAPDPQRGDDATDLRDPLTLKQKTALLSALMQALRNPPYVMVEAMSADADEAATKAEQWVNPKASQAGFSARLYDISDIALDYPFAPMYVGWKQITGEDDVTLYRRPGAEDFVDDAGRQPGVNYEEVPHVRDVVISQGPEYRAVDPWNSLIWPPDAASPKTALGCGEIVHLTKEDLLVRVDEEGYDADVVEELVKAGSGGAASSAPTATRDRNEADGIEYAAGEEPFECVYWYGKLPCFADADGAYTTWKSLLKQDFCFVVCPTQQKVLKFEKSPYARIPYVDYGMYRRANRRSGRCLPEMLWGLQVNADANIQWSIDCMNFSMSPAMKGPESLQKYYSKRRIFPGAYIPYRERPDEIQPFELQTQGINAGLAVQQWIDTQGADLASTQATQLQPKVRKNAEIGAAMGARDTKFDLYLSCLLEGVQETFELTLAHAAQFLGPEGDEVTERVGKGYEARKVEPEDVKQIYRLTPHASSEMANPETRFANTQMRQQVAVGYWQAYNTMPPEQRPFMWSMAREALENLGVKDATTYIGEEPPKADQLQVMQQEMMAQFAQGVAAGDPQSLAMLEKIESAAMPHLPMQGAGGAPGGPPPMQ